MARKSKSDLMARKLFVDENINELLKDKTNEIDSVRQALQYIGENLLFLSLSSMYRILACKDDYNPNQIKLL